jgi:hypothetical protein
MKGYLVDPNAQTITEVETNGYPDFKELIEVDLICAVTAKVYPDTGRFQNQMDTVWIDDEGLLNHKKDGPYFQISSHPQPLAGKGICLGTDDEGETVSAYMSFEEFKGMVTFPNVSFAGFHNIPPHTEVDPIFGEVQVVGHIARFTKADDPFPEDEEHD